MENRNRNYWRPFWSGLFLDEEAKHFKRMRNSLWLFGYFVFKVNDKTGFLTKNYREISKETGIKAKTIRNWMGNLKNKGYISTKKKGKGLLVYVKKWKTFKHQIAAPDETAQNRSLIDNKNAQFRSDSLPKIGRLENKIGGKILYSREKVKEISQRNRYDINKLNIDINDRYKLPNEFNSLFLTKNGLLAGDLAEGLEDEEGFKFYLSVCRKYPEEFLREILSQVRQIPADKIKRSKGALFNYLIQKYERNNHCR